jgi:hypothetical protein
MVPRKSRKSHKESNDDIGTCRIVFQHGQCLDPEFRRFESHQETACDAGGSEVTQDLGSRYIMEVLASLDFHHERPIDVKIGKVLSEDHTIFIQRFQRELRTRFQIGFSQSMQRPLFMTLFQMATTQMPMYIEMHLSNGVAPFHDVWITRPTVPHFLFMAEPYFRDPLCTLL